MADRQTESVEDEGVKPEAPSEAEEIVEEGEVEKPAAEEVEVPAAEKPAEEEELEIVEERFYDLNLRKAWSAPREARVPRTINRIRAFVTARMRTDDIALSEELNGLVWKRSIARPPRKIRLRVVKDKEGHVIVFPAKGS